MTPNVFKKTNLLNENNRQLDKKMLIKPEWPAQEERNRNRKLIYSPVETDEIWMLSSYPPRECGIATFSQDLRQAIEKMFGDSTRIRTAALENSDQHRDYPGEVNYIFHPGKPVSYKNFTAEVNRNRRVRAVIIQHEFGLFSSQCHADFLRMLEEIKKPVILVMHTVLPAPSPELMEKVKTMIDGVDQVVTMTKRSAAVLTKDYGIAPDKITVIPHGTHLMQLQEKEVLKEKYGLEGRTTLSTFGLIGRNKSIETTLKALPAIVQKHPEIIFLILGRTHPSVVASEGEAYRQELEEYVAKYHLQNNVQFVNHYLSLHELLEYLQLTDIYLFTSKDPNQAVSGTFSYALSAGCAIVSTPIPQAKEILESGCGLFFDFENPQSLATQVLRYLDDPAFRIELGQKAMLIGANTAWENIANYYIKLIKAVNNNQLSVTHQLPPVNTAHLERMTDKTGMIQFCRFNTPDRSSGYTLDDNARALIASLMVYDRNGDENMLQLAETYLRFIHSCLLPNGQFYNYMDEDGVLNEKNKYLNLEDANGRAIWALGYVLSLSHKLPMHMQKKADYILFKAMPSLEFVQSPRAIAFTLKGLYYYHESKPSYLLFWLCETLAERLVSLYKHHSDNNWKWYESYLTYANAVLPEAMLMAYKITGRPVYRDITKESFDFLLSHTFTDSYIRVISNNGWLHKGGVTEGFGEQPIDVADTILALDLFYRTWSDEQYVQKVKLAFNWFLGENHLGQIIYNPATGGCFDGLEEKEVNLNQGAESTLCYLLARLTVTPYYTGEEVDSADMVADDRTTKDIKTLSRSA